MNTASDILEKARRNGFNEERAELIFQMYKILLADEWHELSEKERRNYIKRMFFAVYGAYNDAELMQVLNQVKSTEIYKYAESEGMI